MYIPPLPQAVDLSPRRTERQVRLLTKPDAHVGVLYRRRHPFERTTLAATHGLYRSVCEGRSMHDEYHLDEEVCQRRYHDPTAAAWRTRLPMSWGRTLPGQSISAAAA